jgi:hypothetical protein
MLHIGQLFVNSRWRTWERIVEYRKSPTGTNQVFSAGFLCKVAFPSLCGLWISASTFFSHSLLCRSTLLLMTLAISCRPPFWSRSSSSSRVLCQRVVRSASPDGSLNQVQQSLRSRIFSRSRVFSAGLHVKPAFFHVLVPAYGILIHATPGWRPDFYLFPA